MPDLMLGQCRAYLVARTGSQTSSLLQIATRTGFGMIETLTRRDGELSDGRAVNFFLIHRHLKQSMMAAVIRSIRLSSDDDVRFAPVILFAEDGPYETYLEYVHLGFDDVITLPDKQPMLVQRLTGQLHSEHVYFETQDYFGPDRRRMETAGTTDTRRSPDPHSHTRYTFSRMPGAGIRIAQTEHFARPDLSTTTSGMLRPLLHGHGALR